MNDKVNMFADYRIRKEFKHFNIEHLNNRGIKLDKFLLLLPRRLTIKHHILKTLS